jgi:glycosyltransferase involved in cell wall biosynthesis
MENPMNETTKKIVIASNFYNEIDQCEEWFENMWPLTDAGILIVDSGSTDGTKEFFEKKIAKGFNVVFITDDIIKREGYGPARNQLRELSKKHFPDAHWMAYFDADERILEQDRHLLRVLKEYLNPDYDVVAFPRLDWIDKEMTRSQNEFHTNPDYQARMTRLNSPIKYVRRCHEMISGHQAIYMNLINPKINHFHQNTTDKKRMDVAKLCSYLHSIDDMKDTYPQHHKEAAAFELYKKEGLS